MAMVGPALQALNSLFSPVLPADVPLTRLVSCYARTRADASAPWSYFLVPFGAAAAKVPVPIWFGAAAPGTPIAVAHGAVSATLGLRSVTANPPSAVIFAELEVSITGAPPSSAPEVELVVCTDRTVLVDETAPPGRLSAAAIRLRGNSTTPLPGTTRVTVDLPQSDGMTMRTSVDVSVTPAASRRDGALSVRLYDGPARRQNALFGTAVGRAQLPAVVQDLVDDLLIAAVNRSVVQPLLGRSLLGVPLSDLLHALAGLTHVGVLLDAGEIYAIEVDGSSDVTSLDANVDQGRGRCSFTAAIELAWTPSSAPTVSAIAAVTGPIVRYSVAVVRPDGTVSPLGPASPPIVVTPGAVAAIRTPVAPDDVPFSTWRLYRSRLVGRTWTAPVHVSDGAPGSDLQDTPPDQEPEVVARAQPGHVALTWTSTAAESAVRAILRTDDGRLDQLAGPPTATAQIDATVRLPNRVAIDYRPTTERLILGWDASRHASALVVLDLPRDGVHLDIESSAVPQRLTANIPAAFSPPIDAWWTASDPTPLRLGAVLSHPNDPLELAATVELPPAFSARALLPPAGAQPSELVLGWHASGPARIDHVRLASTDDVGHPTLIDARVASLGTDLAARVHTDSSPSSPARALTAELGGWSNAPAPGEAPTGPKPQVAGPAARTTGLRVLLSAQPFSSPPPIWNDGPGLDALVHTAAPLTLDLRAGDVTHASVVVTSTGAGLDLHASLGHGGGPAHLWFTSNDDGRTMDFEATSPELPDDLTLNLWTGANTADITWNASTPASLQARALVERAPTEKTDWAQMRLEDGAVTLPIALTIAYRSETAEPATAVKVGASATHEWGPVHGDLTLVTAAEATTVVHAHLGEAAPTVAVELETSSIDTDPPGPDSENHLSVRLGAWTKPPVPGERAIDSPAADDTPTALSDVRGIVTRTATPSATPPVNASTPNRGSLIDHRSTEDVQRTEGRLEHLHRVDADATFRTVGARTTIDVTRARLVTGGGPAKARLHTQPPAHTGKPPTSLSIGVEHLPPDIGLELDADLGAGTAIRAAWNASSPLRARGAGTLPIERQVPTDSPDRWDLLEASQVLVEIPATLSFVLETAENDTHSTVKAGWAAAADTGPLRASLVIRPSDPASPRAGAATHTKLAVGSLAKRLAGRVSLPKAPDKDRLLVNVGDWAMAPASGALPAWNPKVLLVPGTPPQAPIGWPASKHLFLDHGLVATGRVGPDWPDDGPGLEIDALRQSAALEARAFVRELRSLHISSTPTDQGSALILEAATGGGPLLLRLHEPDQTARTPGTDLTVHGDDLPAGIRATVRSEPARRLELTWQAISPIVLTGGGTLVTYDTPLAAEFLELSDLRAPLPIAWTLALHTPATAPTSTRNPIGPRRPPHRPPAIDDPVVLFPTPRPWWWHWALDLVQRKTAGTRAAVGWQATAPAAGVRARLVDHPHEGVPSVLDVFAETAPASAALEVDVPGEHSNARLLLDIGRWANPPIPGEPPTATPVVATGLDDLRGLRLRRLPAHGPRPPIPQTGHGPNLAADVRTNGAGLERLDLRASHIHRFTVLQAERPPDVPEAFDLKVSAVLEPTPLRVQLATGTDDVPSTLQVRADEVGPRFGVHVQTKPVPGATDGSTSLVVTHTDLLGDARGEIEPIRPATGMRVFFETGGRPQAERPASTHIPVEPPGALPGGLTDATDAVTAAAVLASPPYPKSEVQALIAGVDALPPGASVSLLPVPDASAIRVKVRDLTDDGTRVWLDQARYAWSRGPTRASMDIRARQKVEATLGNWVGELAEVADLGSERYRFRDTLEPFDARWVGRALRWSTGSGVIESVDDGVAVVHAHPASVPPIALDDDRGWYAAQFPATGLRVDAPDGLHGRVGTSLQPGWGLVGVTAAPQVRIEGMPDCEPGPSWAAKGGDPVAATVRIDALRSATLTSSSDDVPTGEAPPVVAGPITRIVQANTAWKVDRPSWMRARIDTGGPSGALPLSVVLHLNSHRPPTEVLDRGLPWHGDPHQLGRYTLGRGDRLDLGRSGLEARVPRRPASIELTTGPGLMEIQAPEPVRDIVMRTETARWLRSQTDRVQPYADVSYAAMLIEELPRHVRIANGWAMPTLGGGQPAGQARQCSGYSVRDWQLGAMQVWFEGGTLRLGRSPSATSGTLASLAQFDPYAGPAIERALAAAGTPVDPNYSRSQIPPWSPGGWANWTMTDIWYLTLEPTGDGPGTFTIYQPAESRYDGEQSLQIAVVDATAIGRIMSVELGIRQIERGWRARTAEPGDFRPKLAAEIQLSGITGQFAVAMQDLTLGDFMQSDETTAGDWWMCAYDKVEGLENAQFGSSFGTIDARNAPFDPPYWD